MESTPDNHTRPPVNAPDVLDYSGVAPRRKPVRTYLGHSIFALFIFFPIGLHALFHSIRAERALRAGHTEAAAMHASQAAAWGMAALIAAGAALVVGCVLTTLSMP